MFRTGRKDTCRLCGNKSEEISAVLEVCLSCIRKNPEEALKIALKNHRKIREEFNLPLEPPNDVDGIQCNICINNCRIGEGNRGYCGIRKSIGGKLVEENLLHTYYDPIPTNCCASWFCKADSGYNLAVFPFGCSFNCVFCQNWEHKNLEIGNRKNIEDLVKEAEKANCICYFGGTPEPQLPFLLKATKAILEHNNKIRICWEWNGTANPKLVRKCAEFSYNTNGTIKFDLKAYECNLNTALTGKSNSRTLENFQMVAEEFDKDDLLTATTLLIPGYIDKEEVKNIAKFISSLNPNIPYSLLAFHPDFKMLDMPFTSRKLAEECYTVAKRYLKRVHIGNKHLLF
jgi:pyruvate formate lyase activating enzyme